MMSDILTKANQRISELKEREINLSNELSNLRSMPKILLRKKFVYKN